VARSVVCRKYGEELEGLDKPPFPGPRGEDIFNNVSKKAWEAWQVNQTMLINEKHLNLVDAATRKYLQEEMDKFFSNEDYDKAEGYVPPA